MAAGEEMIDCDCYGKGWVLGYPYGVVICADHEDMVTREKYERLQKRLRHWSKVFGVLVEQKLGESS